MSRIRRRLLPIVRLALLCAIALALLGSSSVSPANRTERVRAFTREIEFDYLSWTVEALGVKLSQIALGSERYLSNTEHHRWMLEYLELIDAIQQAERQLSIVYSDPEIEDPQIASTELRSLLRELYERRRRLEPLAEAILQRQIANTASALDLTLGGQPVPAVLYRTTPLPLALIVSPRDEIRQEADISIEPGMTVDQRSLLEERVDSALNVSSLVVGIGGVGLYPTMVEQTSSLDWLSEVVAHEWVHNFLTLRPLGLNYLTSPELRVMNETAASIAGKEIAQEVLKRYYPEMARPAQEEPENGEESPADPPPQKPVFDYYQEMRKTRVHVDALLKEKKIEEAETYMEMRRRVFWEHGYLIRKINQAYFAFYGAYADHPSGGAAGEDPVGAAVRLLRAQSPSLAAFLNRISWMSSYKDLQQAVRTP